MILVDSDILIQYSRGDEVAAIWLEATSERDEFVISVVTEIELLYGSRDKQHFAEIQRLLATFEIIQIEEEISKKASSLVTKYCLSPRLRMPDALIAATALVNNINLGTINKKDFRFIDGLRLVDYP